MRSGIKRGQGRVRVDPSIGLVAGGQHCNYRQLSLVSKKGKFIDMKQKRRGLWQTEAMAGLWDLNNVTNFSPTFNSALLATTPTGFALTSSQV